MSILNHGFYDIQKINGVIDKRKYSEKFTLFCIKNLHFKFYLLSKMTRRIIKDIARCFQSLKLAKYMFVCVRETKREIKRYVLIRVCIIPPLFYFSSFPYIYLRVKKNPEILCCNIVNINVQPS